MNDGIRAAMTIGCDIEVPMLTAAQDASARRAYLEVEAHAEAVPRARRYTRSTLARWGLDRAAYDTELIACELVTNAITASAALPFRANVGLLIEACPGRLMVLVRDGSRAEPVRRHDGAEEVTGRGLGIVEALTTAWGWVPDGHGKVVWALLDLGDQ
jgi:anti-sigma regulatory factor (Ser/Thr protein kinase)